MFKGDDTERDMHECYLPHDTKQAHRYICEDFELPRQMSIHCLLATRVVQERIEVHVAQIPATQACMLCILE